MVITFLCTRVRLPYKDDWRKLVTVIICIRGTLHLPLILRSGSLSVIKRWVNMYFESHPDCKGHTGAMMSIGYRSIMEL